MFLLNTLVNLATFLEEAVSNQASTLTLERIADRILTSGNNLVEFSALPLIYLIHELYHKISNFFL